MNKLEKYNPDVAKKYDLVSKERENTSYTFSKTVYKGITNQFPNQINNAEDLKIKLPEPDYDLIKVKMEASIQEREKEKADQEKILKELAEKKAQKKLVITTNKTNDVQETHQDMKSSHQKYTLEKNDNLLKEKSMLNDVFDFINKL